MSYTDNQNERKIAIRDKVKKKIPCVSEDEFGIAFDMAVSDYMGIRYPSDNDRPDVTALNFDFFLSNWIYKRIIDILERVGMNLKSYSENGLRWEYASGNIDPSLITAILPKAGIPR